MIRVKAPPVLRAGFVVLAAFVAGCEITATDRDDLTVTIDRSFIEIGFGGCDTLTATVRNDAKGPLKGVSWTSADAGIVSIDETTGVMTAVAAGTTKVTARSRFNTNHSATTTVTVLSYSTPADLPMLGIGQVNERYTAEIAVHGNYAYTTTYKVRTRAGVTNYGNVVKIWDVAGFTPVLVDSLVIEQPTITTSDIQISPDSSLLVVATEAAGSIVIYSLKDPAHPARIIRYIEPGGVHTVKVAAVGGSLYAFLQVPSGSGGVRLKIVDISSPSKPVEVSATVMGRPYVHDVFERDGLLFAAVWMDGLSIYDVGGGNAGGSPASPVLIGNVKTPTGKIHNVAWFHDPHTGSKQYAFLGEEATTGADIGKSSAGDIHVIDVSDMSLPKQVATFSVGGAGTHNFSVDEDSGILYAAYYSGGVRAIDIRGDLGSCTAAQKVGSGPYAGMCDLQLMNRDVGRGLTSGYYVWGVQHQGTRLYASDMLRGIVTLDASVLNR